MDPVSNSLSLAKTVGQVSWKIYLFSKDVRHNNQALGDLASELNSLHRAVAGITTTIERPTFVASESQCTEDSSELWSLVQGNLSDTQYTLKNFEALIWPLLPEKDNLAKSVIRTARLGLKQSEITSLRTRIQGHINILNITLQTLTLRATYLAPGAILDKVLPAINELRLLIQRKDLSAHVPPEMVERVGKIRAAARKEMNSATTVASASEANLSIAGDPMPERIRAQTLDWIPEPDYYHVAPEPTEVTLTSASSFRDPGIWSPPGTDPHPATLTNPTSGSIISADESDEDPDEELQAELVQNWFKRGRKLFEEKRFPDAQSYLQKGVEHIEKLPVKRRDSETLKIVQMMIAQCACHSPNLNEAERRLMKITQEASAGSGNEDAIRRCQAMHLLSAVLFREHNFAAAKAYCRRAITGRRKVLGSKDMDYYESLYLMAQIWEAEGLEDAYQHVEVYLDMIPDDVKPKLVKVVDEYPGTPALRPAAGPSELQFEDKSCAESTLPSPSLTTPVDAFGPERFSTIGEPAIIESSRPTDVEILPLRVAKHVRSTSDHSNRPNLAIPSYSLPGPVEAPGVIAQAPPSPRLPPSPHSQVFPLETRPHGRADDLINQPQTDALKRVDSHNARPDRLETSPLGLPITPPHDEDPTANDPRGIFGPNSPRVLSPSVRSASIVSSNSSVYSAEGPRDPDRKRRSSSFGRFFRRKSQPKPVVLPPSARPSNERSNSSPGEPVTLLSSSPPTNTGGRPASVSMGLNAGAAAAMEGRLPKQSLHEFLLERIAEENGQQKEKVAVEYPGLF